MNQQNHHSPALKYKNKYRIPSARLRGWDYRNSGAYFITICTKNGQYFFGECEKGQMRLSTIGAIVQGFWYEIPRHFAHVKLGEFIVMPNHVHGILILEEMIPIEENERRNGDHAPRHDRRFCRDEAVPRLYNHRNNDAIGVDDPNDTHINNTTQNNNSPKSEFFRKISPKAGSVSVVVGSFKSICTKHINRTFPNTNFKWQPRFYDHIIRDELAFQRISHYIINNPQKWTEDEYNQPIQ